MNLVGTKTGSAGISRVIIVLKKSDTTGGRRSRSFNPRSTIPARAARVSAGGTWAEHVGDSIAGYLSRTTVMRLMVGPLPQADMIFCVKLTHNCGTTDVAGSNPSTILM